MPKIVVVGDALIDRNEAIKFLELQPAHVSGSMLFQRFKGQGVRHNVQYMEEALAKDYGKIYIFCPDYIPQKFLTFLTIIHSLEMNYAVIQNFNQIDRTSDERSVIVIDHIQHEYLSDTSNGLINLRYIIECHQIIEQFRTDARVDVYFEEGLLRYLDHKLVLGMLLFDNDYLPRTWVWDRNEPIPEDISSSPKIFKLTNRARALGSFALEGAEAKFVCEMIQNLSAQDIAKRNFSKQIDKLLIPEDAKAQLGILLQECCKNELGFTLIIQDYILPAQRPGTNLLKQFRVTATVDTEENTVEIHHMAWTGKVNETGTLTQNISNLGSSTGEATHQELMNAQERSSLAGGVSKFLLAACKKFTAVSMAQFIGDLAEKNPVIAKSYLLSRHGYDINFPEKVVERLLSQETELLLIHKLIRAYYKWDLQNPVGVILGCAEILDVLHNIKAMDNKDVKGFELKTIFHHQLYTYILHDFKEKLKAFQQFDDKNIISLTYDYIDRLLLKITIPHLPPQEIGEQIVAFNHEKKNAQGINLVVAKAFNDKKNLGIHYLMQSQYSQAIECFNEAFLIANKLKNRNPMFLPQARVFIAYSLLKQGVDDYSEIINYLKAAFKDIIHRQSPDEKDYQPTPLLLLVTAIMRKIPDHESLFPELAELIRGPSSSVLLPADAVETYPQPKVMFGQAKALLEQEDARGALKVLENLIDLFSRYRVIVSDRFKYEVLIMRANIAGRICFFEEGDYDLTFELRSYIHSALHAFEKLAPELKKEGDLQTHASLMKIAGNSKNSNLEITAKTIYIPQGKIGELHVQTKENFAIEGLYTDGFTTRNIIIGISSTQLTLIHADRFLNDTNAFEFLQDAEKIFWFYREGEGKYLKNTLLKGKVFDSIMNNISFWELPSTDIDTLGIQVTFNASQNAKIHPNIRVYSETESRKLNLLRHPDEHKFLALQKISQIIGMRQVWATKSFATKTLCIFNNYFWESIDPKEFKIDESHPLTQEELKLFSPNDAFAILVSKLSDFVKSSGISMPDSNTALTVAYYLESYLNNYDNRMLLVRNITFTINTIKDDTRLTPDELAFFKRLLGILKQSESTVEDIQTFIAESSNLHSTSSKIFSIFLNDSQKYFMDYGLREEIHQYISQSKDMLARAQKLNERGVSEFKAKHYAAALNLFQESLFICVRYCRVDNSMLASGYYNAGRTAYYLKQYDLALGYFAHAQFYRQEKIKPFKQSELDKVLKAMEDCSAAQQDDNAPSKKVHKVTA